jgi:hypothetical protein
MLLLPSRGVRVRADVALVAQADEFVGRAQLEPAVVPRVAVVDFGGGLVAARAPPVVALQHERA